MVVDCRLEQGLTDKGTPKIYWYKDGERVGREGDRSLARIEQSGERLVIDRAETQHSGLWVCAAENSEGKDSAEVQLVVRRRTELAREPQDLEFLSGSRASFQCVAVADPSLQRELSVVWQKDGQEVLVDCAFLCNDGTTCLQPEQLCDMVADCPMTEIGPGGEDEDLCDNGSGEEEEQEEEVSPCDMEAGERFVLADHSLVLCSPTEADLGSYSCLVSSPLEKAIASKSAQLYIHTVFPWWILFLIFLILLLLVCLCVFITCWRRRRCGKGYYNPMDPENLKHNKSDIYYTTEDTDSIMQETDTSGVDSKDPANSSKTPIFTPKTLRHLSGSAGGSLGSLLEDDEFLNRGMNEDGSFPRAIRRVKCHVVSCRVVVAMAVILYNRGEGGATLEELWRCFGGTLEILWRNFGDTLEELWRCFEGNLEELWKGL